MTNSEVTANTEYPAPIFGDGDCDGSGYVIQNPDWPKGDLPYRSHCSGCSNCEPDEEFGNGSTTQEASR